MRVYLPNKKNQSVFTAPGVEYPEASQWVHEDGRPITFKVEFKAGVAEVDRQLGEYLIGKGYAQRTPLHLPFRRFMQGPQLAPSVKVA